MAGVSSSERIPRWVLVVWSIQMVMLLGGLLLWVVQGVIRGVPGPVIAGVYVVGVVDVAVVIVYIVAAGALASVAAILVARVPENRTGWILSGVAAWMVVSFSTIMALYFLHSPGSSQTALANWLGAWTFVVAVPTSLVLMIFPTGRLPSRRWGILPWLALGGITGWILEEAAGPRLGLEEELPNPWANPQLLEFGDGLALLFLPALIGTVASLVVRYRKAARDVRLQMKWVAYGGVLQVGAILLTWSAEIFSPTDFPVEVVLIGMLSTLIVPVALGVAILRYRLYDIDHLVSRTVTYLVLSVLLAAVYLGGVIGIQAIFPSSEGLAVAATTLGLAFLFNPLRRRVQDQMDRRFNRRRFDAERVLQLFTERLRVVHTVEELAADLAGTLQQTLAPASIAVWIRE
ncbi:MAG TPA: hypothetical protein VHL52_12665 [Acidimicrobiia bacterium]|nr:hypothetical protein [Acidimicrobiia bacterium]